MALVTNKDAAAILFNVATILELAEDNPYRIRAYRRAARLLLGRAGGAAVELVDGKQGKELNLPGLGQRLRRKLGELLATGRMRFYVELCAELPDEVAGLMQIPGVGPKTALRLNEELGLATAAEVEGAARAGKIQALYGFGPKREQGLLEGAVEVGAGRLRPFVPSLPSAQPVAGQVAPIGLAALGTSAEQAPLALPPVVPTTLPEAA